MKLNKQHGQHELNKRSTKTDDKGKYDSRLKLLRDSNVPFASIFINIQNNSNMKTI